MAVTLETIRLLTVRAKTEGLSRMEAELAGVSRAHLDVARAAEEAAKISDTSARRQQNVASGWARLTSEMQGSSRAAREYAQTARLIQQAEEQGLTTARQAAQARAMNQTRLQDQTFRGPRVDQSALNSTLGIRDPASGAAKASAATFEAAAREAEALERQVANLRAQLDPLAAVQARFNAELVEYRALASAGAISSSELAAAEGMIAMRLADAEKHMGAAGGAVKLTSGQVQNLGYQLNDVATMLAMGASPFQILASQGGQVVQALGDGPGGMKGSLSAISASIMGLISPTTAIAAGFLAVGTAAIYFGSKAMSLKPVEDLLKGQADIVRELRAAYGLAGEAADDYARRARGAIQSEADRKTEESTARLKQGVGEIATQFFSGRDNSIYRESNVYAPVRDAMEALIASAQKGPPNFIAFREKLSEIEKANPDKAGWWQAFTRGDLARSIADATKPFVDLQRSIEATNNVAGDLQRKLSAAAEVRFNDASEKLRGFVPDQMSDRDRIERAYNETRGRIAQLRGQNVNDRGGREDLEAEALRQRNLALKEVERSEQVIRDGRVLDLRDVGARTTAERAAIAAERERLALSGEVLSDTERSARIQHASDLVFAQDQQAAIDALRDRSRALGDMLTSIQTEGETIDMTRGAAMAYRREQELIVALYRDAEDSGRIVDLAEIKAIEDTTRAAGALTDQLDRLKMVKDQQEELRGLNVRAGLVGASDDEARRGLAVYEKQKDLLRQNIDLQSDFAKGQVAFARAASDAEDAIRRQSDAWGDVRSAGEGAINGLVDGLAEGKLDFEGIANDLKKSLLDLAIGNPLKNMMGGSYGTLADLFSGKPRMPALGSADASAFGTVAMTAAVVNLNGGGLSSLLSGAGSDKPGGAVGAINRLLNPGNDNSASVGLAGNSIKAQVANYFADKGLAPHQIAGILGNVSAESAFNPTAVGDAGQAFGLFQHNDRKNNLFASIGGKGNLGNVQSQLDFAWKELQTTENPAFQRLLASKDVRGATAAFAGFERPRGYSVANPEGADNFSGRLSAAEKSFKEIEGSAGKMAKSASTSASSFTEAGQTMASSATSLTSNLGGTFASLDSEMLRIANDFTPAFGGALQSVLDAFASSLGNKGGFSGSWISALAGSITGGKTGALGGSDAWAGLRLAGGGPVSGPGSSTSDSIPAMLSTGEYVINAAATSRHRKLLDAINGDQVRRYAVGGYVAPSMPSNVLPMQASASASAPSVTVVNQTGVQADAEVTRNPDGSLEIMLRKMVADEISTRGRPANNALRQGFNAKPALKSRG